MDKATTTQTLKKNPEKPARDKPWQAVLLTIFPEMFPGPLGTSLAGQALKSGVWQFETVDIRDHARDKHRSVDDTPFGGGAGMVMRPDVIDGAIRSAREKVGKKSAAELPLIYLTPRGRPLTQRRVSTLADGDGAIILCGRFEGVDERVLEAHNAEEISLGDFVLAGGEIAALAMLDATIRLLPGVIGSQDSLAEESFKWGLLEYPHYTRPRNWDGRAVPEVLLSGHHANIDAWRLEQAKNITRERRPDLWQSYTENKV